MKKTLHPKSLVKSLFLLLLLSVSYYSFTNGGGAPAANTAAPGDGNCTNCHGGTLITSGPNWNNVSITSNIPAGGYTPGTSYTITVSHTQAGINKFGFQFTALSPSNTMAGTLSSGSGSQTVSSGPKTYVTHTAGGTAGAGSNSWSFTWTAPNPGVGNVTFYTTINAANGDNGTSGDQIYAKNVSVPQFSNIPTAIISGIPANSVVCLGDTLHLQGSGNGSPTGFSWTFTGKSPSTSQNVDVIFTSAGTKTITLQTSNSFGNSSVNTKVISVIAKPAATITPSGTVNICGNDSAQLSANFNASFTYLWSPGNETTPTIKTLTPGVYNVKVTNTSSGCFSTSANVTLVPGTKPVPVLTVSTDTICTADSVELTSNTPFTNYAFFVDNTPLQSGTSPVYKSIFTGGGQVQMGLVVTGTNGCKSDTIRQTVFIQPKLAAPVLSCGAKTSSSVEFTWGAVAGSSGYEVSTDTGKTWIAPNGTLAHTIGGLLPNSNAQLWVRALDPSLCAKGNTGTLICTNGACSPIMFSMAFNDKVCVSSATDSGNIQITVGNISTSSYKVQFGNNAYSTSLTYMARVGLGANSIHVRVQDTANLGCPVKDSVITLTGVNPISANPVLAPVAALCKGGILMQPHVLSVQNPNTGAHVFKLFRNQESTPFATLTPAQSVYTQPSATSPLQDGDSVYIVATDTVLGCSKQSAKVKLAIHQAPAAGFTVNANFLEVTLTDTTPDGASRTWNYQGTFPTETNGTQTVNKTYPQKGTYSVTMEAVDLNGCANSATQSFTLINSGLADMGSIRKINLYPNPVKDVLEINVDNPGAMELSVYDMQGRLVKQVEMTSSGKLDLGELRNGLYSLYVKQGDALYNGKFIKE